MASSTVGWIGLGNMGSRMAPRLLPSGRRLIVFDTHPDRMAPLVAAGADAAASVGALGAGCGVVFSSLPNDAALAEVAGTLSSRMAPGSCLVDTSTVSPAASARAAAVLAERGIDLLRAPVSGSTALAAEGRLSFFVSGPQAALERHRALFDLLGRKLSYMGSGEEARVLKLVVNLVVAVTNGGLAEALDFGRRNGLDWSAMIDGLADSVAASPYVLSKVDKLKRRDWTAAAPVRVIAKDLDATLEAGRQSGAYLPQAALARQSLAALEGRGGGGLDMAAVVTLLVPDPVTPAPPQPPAPSAGPGSRDPA